MIWLLLVLFQLKHFFADGPLQNKYMLGKFLPGREFVLPLAAHSGVHAGFTLLIAGLCTNNFKVALSLALIDFVIHFAMDRVKASPKLLGQYKALSAKEYIQTLNDSDLTLKEKEAKIKGNTYFWWSLMLDQGVHHLTHYGLIYMILRNL